MNRPTNERLQALIGTPPFLIDPFTPFGQRGGFECWDGWYDIITDCARKLLEVEPRIIAAQVKEKFGGLRFYLETPVDESGELIDMSRDTWQRLHDITDEAEALSLLTCEWCGQPGALDKSRGWWIKTLCEEHAVAWKDWRNW